MTFLALDTFVSNAHENRPTKTAAELEGCWKAVHTSISIGNVCESADSNISLGPGLRLALALSYLLLLFAVICATPRQAVL